MTDRNIELNSAAETTHFVQQFRRCPKCGKTKPIREWYRNGKSKDGWQFYCKNCMLSFRADFDRIHRLIDFGVKNYFLGHCAYCGKKLKEGFHHDHFIPFSKGGAYTPDNIVPACPSCNYSKHNRDPYSWVCQHFGQGQMILLIIEAYFAWIKEKGRDWRYGKALLRSTDEH